MILQVRKHLADHLTSLDGPTEPAVTFTIDALGRSRTRTVGTGTAESLHYLGTADAVVRIGGGSTPVDAAIDPAGTRLATRQAGGSPSFLLPDLHGNVAALWDQAAAGFGATFRYDPYGELISSPPGGSTRTPWRYQGRLLEGEASDAELYDFGFRSYAADTGAFASLDSVKGGAQDVISLNRFLYANANPTTLIDPTGHAPCVPGKKCNVGGNIASVDAGGTATVYQAKAKNAHSKAARKTNVMPPDVGIVRSVDGIAVNREGAPFTHEDFMKLEHRCFWEFRDGACDSWRAYMDQQGRANEMFCAENAEVCRLQFEQTVLVVATLTEAALTIVAAVTPVPGDEVAIAGAAAAQISKYAANAARLQAILADPSRNVLHLSSSRALRANLVAAGLKPMSGDAAHHVVAGQARLASGSRAILHRFGIDIDEAANGVFLPAHSAVRNSRGASVHSSVHTKTYHEWVQSILEASTTREEALDALRFIADQLARGNAP